MFLNGSSALPPLTYLIYCSCMSYSAVLGQQISCFKLIDSFLLNVQSCRMICHEKSGSLPLSQILSVIYKHSIIPLPSTLSWFSISLCFSNTSISNVSWSSQFSFSIFLLFMSSNFCWSMHLIVSSIHVFCTTLQLTLCYFRCFIYINGMVDK